MNKSVEIRMVIKMDYTELINAGTDIDSLIKRLGDGEKMIGKLFAIFLKDKSFSDLTAAIADDDHDKAVAASHTLKGMCGNMSLTELFKLFKEQVNLMRADKWDEAYQMMGNITEKYENAKQKIQLWLDNECN